MPAARSPRKLLMSRLVLLLVMIPLAAGCGRTPDAAAGPAPTPPAGDPNWRAKFGLPEEVAPDRVPFADRVMRERFLKLDAAARRIAGPDWARRAGDRYPFASWNTGSDGFNQTYTATWEKAAPAPAGKPPVRPNHTIAISVMLYHRDPPPHHGFELYAAWTPEEGWACSLSFGTHDGTSGPHESFGLSFQPVGKPSAGRSDPRVLDLGPGRPWFGTTRKDDRYAYEFAVRSTPPGGLPAPTQVGRDVARYLGSAESFRDAALAELGRLEANARAEIPTGRAASIRTPGGPTGADVPMPVPRKDPGGPDTPGVAAVPEAVRGEVLKEALADIEGRAKLVRQHYKELHTAAVAAFPPLAAILAPKE